MWFFKKFFLIDLKKNKHLCKLNIPEILRNIDSNPNVFQISMI